MRSFVIACLVAAACSAEDNAPPWDCQPLCQSPNGSVLGSDTSYTSHELDQDSAEKDCKDNAPTEACPSGQTIMRCSCELSTK
jgi:hypothetical protein